jgi:superfamily II DNA helicase RecQ
MLQINKDVEITEEQKQRKRQALLTVNAFCQNEIDCRRMLILNHFTEAFDPVDCNGTCDNCASTGEVEEVNLTGSALLFVAMIQEVQNGGKKITGPLGVHAFRGTSGSDMARRGFNNLENFGKGSNISAELAKRLLGHLVARQILSTELEESHVPNRAPISYVHVRLISPVSSVSRANRTPGIAWARSRRIPPRETTLPVEGTLHEESVRRAQVHEGCGSCSNDLGSEKTPTSRNCR